MLSEGVAGYARHLANRPIEDEEFEMTPWSPKPPRKTLLPIPEHGLRPTLVPTDALGDAHEAMLDAMEGFAPEPQTARIETKGPAPAIIRPNEGVKEPVAEVIAEERAPPCGSSSKKSAGVKGQRSTSPRPRKETSKPRHCSWSFFFFEND